MSLDFQDKKIVIIGGSAGIGLATAKALAARGAEIVIASRSKARLTAATAQIGNGAVGHQLEVADARAVEEFFETVGPFDQRSEPSRVGR